MSTEDVIEECPNCGTTEPYCWFDSLNYDAVETDFDNAVACSDCYVNEDCPDGCAEPHDMPEPDNRGQWSCPTTGTRYRYDGGENGVWEYDRWDEGSHYIDGAWWANPGEYGYANCDACGEWGSEDYVCYSERNDAYYCACCREQYDRGDEADSSRYATCSRCHSHLGHTVRFDPDTEATYCAEHAPAKAVIFTEAA